MEHKIKKKIPQYIYTGLIAIGIGFLLFVLYGVIMGWSLVAILTHRVAIIIYVLLLLWGGILGSLYLLKIARDEDR